MVMRSKEEVITDIGAFIGILQKHKGEVIKVSALAFEYKVPYKGNIAGALLNLGLIKFVKLGSYEILEYESTYQLATAIRATCIELTGITKKKQSNNMTDTTKPITANNFVSPKVTNPFGFTAFDEIMVEKGTIKIGGYMLTGSFTITKTIKTLNNG